MIRGIACTAIVMVALAHSAANAEVWKCTDVDGNTRYATTQENATCKPIGLVDKWKQFAAEIKALNGKPISAAVKRLGYPAREQSIAGKKLVVWEPPSALCRLTLEVDSANIVQGSQIDGSEASCMDWASARGLVIRR